MYCRKIIVTRQKEFKTKYELLRCTRRVVRTTVATESDVWNGSLPQVWNSNAVKDEFMGQVVLSGLVKDSPNPQKLQLRKGNGADEMPGNISLRIVTATQLTAIWPPRTPDRGASSSERCWLLTFLRRVICDRLKVNFCLFFIIQLNWMTCIHFKRLINYMFIPAAVYTQNSSSASGKKCKKKTQRGECKSHS